MAELDWDNFKVILALHRGGSVAAAARILEVDPSTVSRRLSAAEEAMNTVLIVRGGREFHFTPEGERAAAAAEAMEAAVSEANLAILASKSELDGVVRIACPPAIVHFLGRFGGIVSATHPDLGIELLSGRAPTDLAKGEADISVRSLGAADPDLVVAHRFDLGSGIYASQTYLEEHGRPESTNDLAVHKLVQYGSQFLHLPAFNWVEDYADPEESGVRVDSIDMARSLIIDGHGVGALFCLVGDRTPGLVRVFEDAIDQMKCAIVYHQSSRGSARIRAVLDLLVGHFIERGGELNGLGDDA